MTEKERETLDLIGDIEQSSEEYEHALFGTYTYDSLFFESKVLPILQKRDAENILVLVDRAEYDSNFTQTKVAGKEYYLDHCSCGKVFHPKFSFLTWEGGGKLVIGSANLNENEWRTAGEIVVSIDYDIKNPDKDAQSVFYEMSQFVQALVKIDVLKSRKHRQKIMQMVIETKWLSSLEGHFSSDKIRLLNNMKQPILVQLLDLIRGEPIVEVEIMSPFFGDIELLLAEFFERGCKKLKIFLQPEKVIGFSANDVISLRKRGIEVEVFSSQFIQNEGRYNHAKIIIIKSKQKSYCLMGSANVTKAALLEIASIGNLELSILRMENQPSYFDYTMAQSVFNTKIIDASKIPFSPFPIRKDSKSNLLLTDARFEGNTLTIEFEPNISTPYKAEVILRHPSSTDELTLFAETSLNSAILKLSEGELQFCSNPTAVTLKLNTEKHLLISSPRWISTEYLEMSPRRRDIQSIKESNGRVGLINMLNQLSKSSNNQEFLLYCLQWLNFDDLAASIDSTRRRIFQPNPNGEDDGAGDLFEVESIDRKEIARKILQRHQKKFEKALWTLDEDIAEKIPRILDLYLFIGKITIWLIQYNSLPIEELRWIWYDSELLITKLQKLRATDPKTIDNLVKENSILEHAIVLGYIVAQMHRKVRYASKYPNVTRIFSDTMNRMVASGLDFGYPRDALAMTTQLKTIVKEYKEFNNLQLDDDMLFQYFNSIFPNNAN